MAEEQTREARSADDMPAEVTPPTTLQLANAGFDAAAIKYLAETAYRSGYFKDATSASKAAMKILFGQELGMGPGASMRGVHVFDGKMELASATMVSLINRAPNYELEYVEMPTEDNGWTCRLKLWRVSKRDPGKWAETPEVARSLKDAQRAGLTNKPNWKGYPADMVYARCLSALFREFCAELGAGPVYTEGEIQEAVTADYSVSIENIEKRAAEQPVETVDDLNARVKAEQEAQKRAAEAGEPKEEESPPEPSEPLEQSEPVQEPIGQQEAPESPEEAPQADEPLPAGPGYPDPEGLALETVIEEVSRVEGLIGPDSVSERNNQRRQHLKGIWKLDAAAEWQLRMYLTWLYDIATKAGVDLGFEGETADLFGGPVE